MHLSDPHRFNPPRSQRELPKRNRRQRTRPRKSAPLPRSAIPSRLRPNATGNERTTRPPPINIIARVATSGPITAFARAGPRNRRDHRLTEYRSIAGAPMRTKPIPIQYTGPSNITRPQEDILTRKQMRPLPIPPYLPQAASTQRQWLEFQESRRRSWPLTQHQPTIRVAPVVATTRLLRPARVSPPNFLIAFRIEASRSHPRT